MTWPGSRAVYFARSAKARPIRFLVIGGATFVVQLVLLKAFEAVGLGQVIAYLCALALAVQFNFAASQLLVWHDRPLEWRAVSVFRRWLSFHTWIAFSVVINFVAFVIAQLFVSDILATVIAVAASTVVKFLSLDRLTFRSEATR